MLTQRTYETIGTRLKPPQGRASCADGQDIFRVDIEVGKVNVLMFRDKTSEIHLKGIFNKNPNVEIYQPRPEMCDHLRVWKKRGSPEEVVGRFGASRFTGVELTYV